MKIEEKVDLSPYNTFNVKAEARYLAQISSEDEIKDLVQSGLKKYGKTMVLGKGANILFIKDFEGLVVVNKIKERRVVESSLQLTAYGLQPNENSVFVEVGAGEDWPEFVMWTVENGWSGLENMAFIPGTVGAAPIGNIAAYGQCFSDQCVSVKVVDMDSGESKVLEAEECGFAYRDSIFKHNLAGKYFVTGVIMKLSKTPHFDTAYHSRYKDEALEKFLKEGGEPPYTPKNVADAVVRLRQYKLPDWKKIGTAGSVFKNPFIHKSKLEELKAKISELQYYPTEKMLYLPVDDPLFNHLEYVKLPVGRLLDELGWRGKRVGNVGTFEKHALVVVAYPGATGTEIFDFTEKMRKSVEEAYGVKLEYEILIVK